MAKKYCISVDNCFQCPNSEKYDEHSAYLFNEMKFVFPSKMGQYYCWGLGKFISEDINEYEEIHPDCTLDDE
jgi:hypothetical protein